MVTTGLLSCGLGLCVAGVAWLVQSLSGFPAAAELARFWGLAPLAFGLELLIKSYRTGRQEGPSTPVRLHVGAAAALAFLALIGALGSGWPGCP